MGAKPAFRFPRSGEIRDELWFDASRRAAYKCLVMRTPGFHTRGRLYAGLGLVWICCSGGPACAGDKVTFTDSEDAAPRVERSQKTTPQSRRRVENFLDRLSQPRGGSLEAVTPPPFAPAVPGNETVVPLTEKEWQRLKERQNWIHRRPEDLGKADRDLPAGLGGRDENQPGLPDRPSTTPKARQGWLTEYYERLSKDRSQAETAVPEPLQNSPWSTRDRRRSSGTGALAETTPWPGAPSPAGDSLRPVEAAGFGRSEAAAWERSAMTTERPREADSPTDGLTHEPSWLRSAGSPERDRFGLNPLTAPMPTPPGTPALEGVARILGQNPIGNPLAANPLSSLDPVTAYPDPTRELLNPVTPVKSGLGQNARSDAPGQGNAETTPARSRMLSASPGALSSMTPASAGTDVRLPATPSAEARQPLQSIKLNLELPRRSF